jgi:ABC-type bacteriocin/lantibiotic exporter with double-glycine peptidase domain
LAIALLGLVIPYASKLLFDDVYPTRDISFMHVLVAGILALQVALALIGAIRGYFSQVVSSQLNAATNLLFFNHLQFLPTRFYDEHRIGEVLSRFQDVRSSLATISQALETVVLRGTYLVLVPPFLFLLNWKLAIISLLTTPLTTIAGIASSRFLRRFWKQSAEAWAEVNALQVETLSHIRTFKALAAERETFRKMSDQVQGALKLQLYAGGFGTVFTAFNALLGAGGMAIFSWYAWTLILHQELTLGSFMAFSAYRGYLMGPLNEFASLVTGVNQMAVTFGRMFEYLDERPEQDPATAYQPTPLTLIPLDGAITLEGIHFGYDPTREVLTGMDVEFSPGTVTAIVGASGAGKSTLLSLITRSEIPTAGRVRIGGVDIAGIPLRDLRRQISIVRQEVALVRGTLLENLTLGADTPPSRREIDEAVQTAHIAELVASFPAGYDTPVSEWGASLSGGQRQRIAIARALLRKAPYVLFDEATSNIDVQTEREILLRLFASLRERTVVFVTHRVSTAALADRICVVCDGRIAGFGPHVELLAGCDAYRRLYETADIDGAYRMRVLRGRGA